MENSEVQKDHKEKLPLSKVWVHNLKYEYVVQGPFKILLRMLEDESYENKTSLINKLTKFFDISS